MGVCIFQSPTETQAGPAQGTNRVKKSSHTVRTKGWWRRGDLHTGTNAKVMQCWMHKDEHTALMSTVDEQTQMSVVTKTVQALKVAWEESEQRDDFSLDLHGPGRHFWAGTEAGLLGAYNFQGIQAGGDGSAHQQQMGAGVWCRHVRDQGWSKIGRAHV